MSFSRVLIVASASTLLFGAFAQSQSKGTENRSGMASPDHAFVMNAMEGGQHEVEMGRLAVQKATNSDVKAFGQRMVDDHSKANSELEAIARKKGISEPAKKQAPEMSKLNNLSGAAFDREYVRIMVDDHEKDVKEFEKESQSGSDPDVKAFAAKTLPTLRSHLEQVKTLKP